MKSAVKGLVICALSVGCALAENAAPAPTAAVSADAAREWRDYVEPLLPIGEKMLAKMRDPNDPQLRQELYKFLYSQIAAAYVGLVYASPEYPDFWPMFNEVFNQGFPNPDDAYYLTVVDADGVYKISGFRGTVRLLDLQVGSGPLNARGTGSFGPTLANYDFDSLHLGKDGAFEVMLSPTRPDGYTGDWWPLQPTATYLLVRQRAYDLLHEVDGRLAIERMDRPAIKPRPSAQALAASLRDIPAWVEGWTTYSLNWVNRLREQGLINKLQVKDYSMVSGLSTQRYVEGAFDLAAGEALIIETEVPKQCRYWNFQLTDELWSSVGYVNRQSSLTGFTAKLDRDGKFRAVVSAEDPGVPNWLDNGGLKQGLVYGRWTGCSSNPTPTVIKVKTAEVRKYLPADTPSVSSGQRDAAVRLHRQGVQLRRRW
jgi:hypothetical protein